MDFGLIDINIPPITGEQEEGEEEGKGWNRSLIQNAKNFCLYIWDNYVEYTRFRTKLI
jgi:hypothetical protein